MRVLLVTEGTYPYATGGVSTWCHALVHTLEDVDFDVVALTADPTLAAQGWRHKACRILDSYQGRWHSQQTALQRRRCSRATPSGEATKAIRANSGSRPECEASRSRGAGDGFDPLAVSRGAIELATFGSPLRPDELDLAHVRSVVRHG